MDKPIKYIRPPDRRGVAYIVDIQEMGEVTAICGDRFTDRIVAGKIHKKTKVMQRNLFY